MNEPRIVTPQEAQRLVENEAWMCNVSETPQDLAHTVATEPERTYAAVVKALRDAAEMLRDGGDDVGALFLDRRADAVENGADYA